MAPHRRGYAHPAPVHCLGPLLARARADLCAADSSPLLTLSNGENSLFPTLTLTLTLTLTMTMTESDIPHTHTHTHTH